MNGGDFPFPSPGQVAAVTYITQWHRVRADITLIIQDITLCSVEKKETRHTKIANDGHSMVTADVIRPSKRYIIYTR